MRDQLTHESFVILECDHALVIIPCGGLLELHPFFDEPLYPEAHRAGKNREGCNGDLTAALSTAARVGPGKECQDTARTSVLVPEVEVIGGGVVEVHGALDEEESEDAGGKIEGSMWVVGDTGDVMHSGSPEGDRADYAGDCVSAERR